MVEGIVDSSDNTEALDVTYDTSIDKSLEVSATNTKPKPSRSKPKKDLLTTKQCREFCDNMLEYFDVPPFRTITVEGKGGKEYQKEIPSKLPTIEGFARTQGISSDKIRSYAENYPEVNETFARCYDMMFDMFLNNSLMGLYEYHVAVFAMKNILKFSDKGDGYNSLISNTGDNNTIINNNFSIKNILFEIAEEKQGMSILDDRG